MENTSNHENTMNQHEEHPAPVMDAAAASAVETAPAEKKKAPRRKIAAKVKEDAVVPPAPVHKCGRCNETVVMEENALCPPCEEEYRATEQRRREEEAARAEEEKAKEEPKKKKKAPVKPKVKRAIVECVDCHEDFTVEGESKATRCEGCEATHQASMVASGNARPVAFARTLANSKAKLSDDRLAQLIGETDGDVAEALKELAEFRRIAEEKRQRANESSKKSKAKARGGGGGGDGEGGGDGGAPKEPKAVRDAKLIAALTADAVVKKMKGTEEHDDEEDDE